MYACPLCPTKSDSNSNSPAFGSFDSLSAHIDLAHCPITAPTKISNEINRLEFQIRNYANSQIYEFQQQRQTDRRERTIVSTKFDRNFDSNSFPHRQHPQNASTLSNLHNPALDLLNFPKDYEYVKLENDYLKGRLRELERNSLRDQRSMDDKNLTLVGDMQTLTSFLKDTQRVQRKSKRNLQNFLSNLLSDLEDKEKTISEVTTNSTFNNSNYVPNVPLVAEDITRVPTKVSLRTRKFSGQSIDSGYQDGTDSIRRRQHLTPQTLPLTVIPNKKTTSYPEDMESLSGSYANQKPGPSYENIHEPTTVKRKEIFMNETEAVLSRIFWYLDSLTLLKCTTVCRQWRKMAENPAYWKRIYISNVAIDNVQLSAIAKRCFKTTSLTMKNIQFAFAEDEKPLTTKGILEKSLGNLLRNCSTYLMFLKISECCPYLTDRTLWLLSCHCHRVQTIIYISKLFPISAPVVWSIGASCRQLECFIVPSSKEPLPEPTVGKLKHFLKFDDNCLLMISRCWPTTLKQLSIFGQHVTLAGLSQLVEHCKNLETFEIEFFSTLHLTSAQHLCKKGLRYLKTLNLIQTKIVADAVLCFCSSLPNIEKILISWKNLPVNNYSEIDEFVEELYQIQKFKETNPVVDRIVRIILTR